MKSLFVLFFIILGFNVEAVPPAVNGGSKPMILLPATSINTLSVNGTGTPATYPWSEIFTNHLSGATASPPSSLLTGIISYWKLDESSGNAIDAAGGGNNGTPTSVTQGAPGEINTAYSFNGTSSKVDMGNPSNLSITTSGSISVWVYFPTLSTSNDQIIVEKADRSEEPHV